MKRPIYYTIVVILITVLGLQNCKKENLNPNSNASINQNLSSIQIQNGRLVFNNSKSLDSITFKLNTKSQNYLDTWEKSINFSSYRTYVNNTVTTNWNNFLLDGNKTTPEIKYADLSNFYRVVLNQKGEVMAGDTIYYFTSKTNVYAIHYVGESVLQSTEKALSNHLTKSANVSVRNIALRWDTIFKTSIALSSNSRIEESGPSGANFPGGDAFWQGEFNEGGINYKIVFQANVGSHISSGSFFFDVQNYLTHQSGSSWPIAGQVVSKCSYLTFAIYTQSSGWIQIASPNTWGGLYGDGRNGIQPESNNTTDDIYVDSYSNSNDGWSGNPLQNWQNSGWYPITKVKISGYMYCYGPNYSANGLPQWTYSAPGPDGDAPSGLGICSWGWLNNNSPSGKQYNPDNVDSGTLWENDNLNIGI